MERPQGMTEKVAWNLWKSTFIHGMGDTRKMNGCGWGEGGLFSLFSVEVICLVLVILVTIGIINKLFH